MLVCGLEPRCWKNSKLRRYVLSISYPDVFRVVDDHQSVKDTYLCKVQTYIVLVLCIYTSTSRCESHSYKHILWLVIRVTHCFRYNGYTALPDYRWDRLPFLYGSVIICKQFREIGSEWFWRRRIGNSRFRKPEAWV